MGSACCVAARDGTIASRTPSEALQRHVRHSPSWSFLLDNRGRVAGAEMSTNILLDGGGADDHLDVKSTTTAETAFASEEGSSLDSFRALAYRKSTVSDGNGGILRFPSDPSVSRKIIELNEPAESTAVSYPSPAKLSPSAPSVSPVLTSPLSSHSHMLPPKSTPSRWSPCSTGQQLLRQVPDSPIPEHKSHTFSISGEASSFALPSWSYESTRESNGGSSDGWSIPPLSELMTTRKERWSFDSENSGFSRDKITRSAGRNSGSSPDLQNCGVCAKLLTERSSLGTQKIITTNELAVVAVLTCGHAYHAECLEYMTPEINKYDPACPVCTFGEKRTMKMSDKAIKAELDLKARKRSRNRVVDSDDLIVFDHHKCGGNGGRSPKMSSSSSMKSSSGMPFLRRHFSFGTRGHKSFSENHSTRRKGFFWSKSSKE